MDLEQLREICLALPATTESIKWESNLVFSVGHKMCCLADIDGPLRFTVKVDHDSFDAYTSRPHIEPAPYLARAGWVMVSFPESLSKKEIREIVANSHALIGKKLSKKQRRSLGFDL